MFDDINSVDWKKLAHSHGTAEEVPSRLRALTSPSEDERESALDYFWEYMLHQGSRYEASPFVVPFLFEPLEQEDCHIQRELIDLLLGLAVGLGESFLPRGYDLEKEEKRFQEESWDGLFSYDAERDAYYEVHRRAELFARFLSPDYDLETRLSASFALAHFSGHLADYRYEVENHIVAASDEQLLHGLILSFGMLARFADSPDVGILLPFVDGASSKTLQVSASIALITSLESNAPMSAVDTLFSAVREAWPVSSPRENHLWWNEGDLLGYAALSLRLLGPERRNEIAEGLCAALSKLGACTYSVPQTLLDLLFPEPMPSGGWKEADFDDVQRASLTALLRTRHWTAWMISAKFLSPELTGDDYQAALSEFVSEFTKAEPLSWSEVVRRSGNVSTWDEEKHWP